MRAWLVAWVLLVAGGSAAAQRADSDPLEPVNRAVFAFNDGLDRAVVQPVARAYVEVVPAPLRNVIGNVIGNVADAWSAINLFLQAKPRRGLEMTMRVATNSVFGLGGALDVASEAGLDRQSEDFGQTLGRWGVPAGPYIVWPMFGPSSLRESLAMPVDGLASPTRAAPEERDRLAYVLVAGVDARARLLGATRVLDDVALDRYQFVRDAYLARRRNLVYDGEPPPLPDDDAGGAK